MTTPTTGQHPDDPKDLLNLIAAQYVLGTLSNSARLRFQTLMQQQPALRQLTHAWERRLNPLASLLEPQDVPAHVWQRIEAKLDILSQLSDQQPAPHHHKDSAPGHATVNATQSLNTGTASTGGERKAANEGFWQPLAWVSTAIAASLALFIALKPQLISTSPPPMVVQAQPLPSRDVAVLSDDSKQPAWIVRQQGNTLLLSQMNTTPVPENHDLELWSIKGSAAPKSLGVVRATNGKAIIANIPAELLASDVTLAITLEGKNGSPTGKPLGSVVYVGKMV